MSGYFSLVLHAHLPFVRHPEHDRFLEESWLFEAITETYIPLLQMMDGWARDGVDTRLTLTLTPTLCAMLNDTLLRDRYTRRLENLIELTEREVRRTRWDNTFHELARSYQQRFTAVRETWLAHHRDLVGAFRQFQDTGKLEIITCAATHALLPLLVDHPPSLRAQILVARDHYRACFGHDPRGIWLPECAYAAGVDQVLQEANIRWFITDTHGLLHARPKPRYGVFAPVFTPHGIAAFGRDRHSAEQVWSRDGGYPGDPRYRDFYRDIGFDLDFNYVQPVLPAPHLRGFTGIKYHRITGKAGEKQVYNHADALRVADAHAEHFLADRRRQFQRLGKVLDRPPLIVAPYDAELFGHWWHEGPEFLNYFVRKAVYDQRDFTLITPTEYLRAHPTQQVAQPAASSWGEAGHWRVWLNETNEWIYPHLRIAQERMTALAQRFPRGNETTSLPSLSSPSEGEERVAEGRERSGLVAGSWVKGIVNETTAREDSRPTELQHRALAQAARELLLAQASDWPFILRSGTHADYARQRVETHLLRFTALYEQLNRGQINESALAEIEAADNIFPDVNYRYWA